MKYKVTLVKGIAINNAEYRCRICNVKYPTDKYCQEFAPGKFYSHDFILKKRMIIGK